MENDKYAKIHIGKHSLIIVRFANGKEHAPTHTEVIRKSDGHDLYNQLVQSLDYFEDIGYYVEVELA